MTVHPRLTTSRRHRPSLEIIKTDVCARERENESNRELIVRTRMISARQRKIFYVLWYFWITLRDAFHTTRRMKCSFFAYADLHTSIERSLRVAVRLLWNQWHAMKLQAVLCKLYEFFANFFDRNLYFKSRTTKAIRHFLLFLFLFFAAYIFYANFDRINFTPLVSFEFYPRRLSYEQCVRRQGGRWRNKKNRKINSRFLDAFQA